MVSIENRRKHPRFNIDQTVQLLVNDRVKEVTAVNISEGGIRLRSDHLLTPSDKVMIVFKLTDAIFLDLECEVVHSSINDQQEVEIGCKFIDGDSRFASIVIESTRALLEATHGYI